MQATFRIKSKELTPEFLKNIKRLYKGQDLLITIQNIDELDETEYLLASEANRNVLFRRIKDVQEGKNLISVNPKDL